MGMNFDYGQLGVNNAYAPSFQGTGAQMQQAASMPTFESVSDYDLLTLSTKEKENDEKKSKTLKTIGVIGGVALLAATIYAHSKGKKINGGEKGFFKNIGTGFKNFFKHVDDAGNVVAETGKKAGNKAGKNSTKKAKEITQDALDQLTETRGKTQKEITELEKQMKKLKGQGQTGTQEYKEAAKKLKAKQKLFDKQTTQLKDMQKGQLLNADGTYRKMKSVKGKTNEELAKLQEEKANLAKKIKKLEAQKAAAAKKGSKVKFGKAEQDKLDAATTRLQAIGSATVKGKGGVVQTAGTGEIGALEKKLADQKSEIKKFSALFDDVIERRFQAAADADALATYQATIKGSTLTAKQQSKLDKLKKAAEASKKACEQAETTWATNVSGFSLPAIFGKAKP